MPTVSSRLRAVVKWTAGAVYVLAGLALFVFGLPLASLPFHWEGFARWAPWFLMALPVWLGMASAPGCLFALTRVIRKQPGSARWIRLSLWGALSAATAGIAGGSLMALFIPFGLVGMIGSIVLLFAIDEVRRRSPPFVRRWWAKVSATAVGVFVVTLWALHAGP